jgi:hypothetical protein
MRKLLQKLLQIGIVEGITFRCVIEDGVGPVLVPNPTPNRMQVQAVPAPSAYTPPAAARPLGVAELTLRGTGRRFWTVPLGGRRRRVSTHWTAKGVHITW